jgi:uncharacterized repeat protein (TIGR02543 family)
MIIKSYKFLSNWLRWVVLILMMGISPIIQAETDSPRLWLGQNNGYLSSCDSTGNCINHGNKGGNAGFSTAIFNKRLWVGREDGHIQSCDSSGVCIDHGDKGYGIYSMIKFAGKLWIGGYNGLLQSCDRNANCVDHKYDQGSSIHSMALFAGKLWVGWSSGGLRSCNSLGNCIITHRNGGISAMSVFANKLWIAANGSLQSCDNNGTCINNGTQVGSYRGSNMRVFAGKLWLGDNDGNLKSCDSSGICVNHGRKTNNKGREIRELVTFNGKLWLGDIDGNLHSCDESGNCVDHGDKGPAIYSMAVFPPSTTNYTIDASIISPNNSGYIALSPNKSNYSASESVNLTATPKSCYIFKQWSGACSGNNIQCNLTMDTDKSISAEFQLNTYTLTVTAEHGNITYSSPGPNYNCGTSITLKAVPDTGYNFVGWEGDASGSDPNISITMNGDKIITAIFEAKTYTLSISSDPKNGGSVSRSPAKDRYIHNETVKLTATPNIGHHFVRWKGDASGSSNTAEITMDNNKTITAVFKLNPHTLSISTTSGGSVVPNPNKSPYYYGDEVNLTANSEQCYKFTGWGGACAGNGIHPKCSLKMISDKSVTANFEIKSFKLKINSDNGSIERQPNKTLYDCGETVKLTARPNQGYKFKAWNGDINSSNENITVNMDADLNITATFEPVTYKLNLSILPLNLPPDVTVNINPQKSDYNAGEKVTLTANPSSDYSFDHWQGDISGNQTTITVVIAQDMNITAVFKQVQAMNINPSFVEMNLGEIKILNVSGGVEPYQWSSNGGQLSPTIGKQVNFSANITNTQDYKITVTDSRNETSEATIKVYSELKVSPNVITMEIEETKSFEITGGKPPYSVDNGQTSSITDNGNGIFSFNFTAPDTAGNITLTITDALSKQQSAQISVQAPEPLKVTPTGPLTLSFGENIELTASDGQAPYNWTITNGQLTAKQGSSTTYIAPKIAGDYKITLTDNRGEKAEVEVKVIAELICTPTLVTVILGDPNPVTFKAAGGAEPYKWSADNGPVNPVEAEETNYQPPAQTGEYHVTCKDNKDSSITALVRVVPSVAITPAQIDLAIGEVATLQVTGGQKPYTWTTEAGYLSSTSGSRVSYTAPTRNGVYSITVTDALKQAAKARIQVLGNLIISPIKTVVTIGENIHLSAARGAEPYTWPDSKTGRTWNTKFTQVGRQEVVVTDAAGDSGLAVVEVIHAELGLTPQTASLHPNEVVNFSVTGGTSPYAWSAEAGTLSNLQGQRVGYVAPEQPGEYTITVADGRDKVGQAKVTVTAGVTDSSGKLQTNRGAIRSGIIIDGVAHKSDHILTDARAHIEISFPLTMPTDGQKYNTYGAIQWTPPQAAPVFLFRTTNITNPFQVFDGATFPVYQATAAGENVVIDIYRGALNGLTGQFNFYAGYAPTTASNVLDSLLFNSKPFSLEIK